MGAFLRPLRHRDDPTSHRERQNADCTDRGISVAASDSYLLPVDTRHYAVALIIGTRRAIGDTGRLPFRGTRRRFRADLQRQVFQFCRGYT